MLLGGDLIACQFDEDLSNALVSIEGGQIQYLTSYMRAMTTIFFLNFKWMACIQTFWLACIYRSTA